MWNYIIILLLCLISQVSVAENYPPLPEIPFEIKSAEDKELISKHLTEFKRANEDSSRLKAVEKIVLNCNNIRIWPFYNDYILDYVNRKLNEEELDSSSKKALLKIKANALNNAGIVYKEQGNIDLALEYYYESLKLEEKLHNQSGINFSRNNIGVIYMKNKDFEKALDLFNKALAGYRESGNREGEAAVLNNLGFVYNQMKKSLKAEEYYKKALLVQEELNNRYGIAVGWFNIGEIRLTSDSLKEASKAFEKSLHISREIGTEQGVSAALARLAEIDLKRSELPKAIEKANASLSIAENLNLPERMLQPMRILSSAYEKLGQGIKSLNYYRKYDQLEDSLTDQSINESIIRQEAIYEYEKARILEDQKRKEKLEKEKARKRRKSRIQYSIILISLIGIFGLILSLGKVQLPIWFAEGLIFFAFLLLFEFILVITDPYIDDLTDGLPAYKLLINAILAAAIFPAHSFFERKMKGRVLK